MGAVEGVVVVVQDRERSRGGRGSQRVGEMPTTARKRVELDLWVVAASTKKFVDQKHAHDSRSAGLWVGSFEQQPTTTGVCQEKEVSG